MNPLFILLCFVTLVCGDGSESGELHFCPEVIRLSSTTAAVIWKQDPEEEYNGSYVVSYGMTENQLDNNISYSSRGEECLNGLIEYKLRIAQLNSSAQYYFQLHATQTSMTQLSMCGSVALPPIPDSESVPDPPSNFCASHISSEAAAFSWSPRNDTILSCYPNNSNVLVFIDDFGSSTASTETPAVFQPYTEYTCDASTKCTEHTCEGSTECTGGDQCAGASTSLHFRTCEAAPGSPPTNVSVEAVNSSQLDISWNPPTTPNGVITHYTLYTIEVIVVSASDGETTYWYSLTGLHPNLLVSVVISASTSAGEGPLSDPVEKKTPEAPFPCITSIQAERSMDGHSMSINWSTCHSSGRIDSYMVIYESLYTLNMECQWIISGRNSSTVVNNLDPLLSYRVYVIGYNSAGIEANNNSVIVPPSTYKSLDEENRTLFVQLRFNSVENCMENHTSAIESALAYRVSLLCSDNCTYRTEEWLTDSTLLCTANRNQVIFLAQLSEHMCTEICYEILEHWTLLPRPFLLVGDHTLLLDSTCPLYTNSLNSSRCSELDNTSIPSVAESNGSAIIVGAFFGGFLSCCLILAIFVVFVAIFYRSSLGRTLRKRMKGKETEEIFKFSTTYTRPEDDKSQQEAGGYEPLACYYSENEGTSKTNTQTSKQTKASKLPHTNAGKKIPLKPKQKAPATNKMGQSASLCHPQSTATVPVGQSTPSSGPKNTGTSNLYGSSDGEYAAVCSHTLLQNPPKVSTKSADADGEYEILKPQEISIQSDNADERYEIPKPQEVSTQSDNAEGEYEILDPQKVSSTNGERQYENLKATASSSKTPVIKQPSTSGNSKAVASSKMPVTKQLVTSGNLKAVASSKMPVTKQLPTSGNQKGVASSKMPVTKQPPTSGNLKAVASSSMMPVTEQLPTSANQKVMAFSKMPVTKQLPTSGIQKLQCHKESAGSAGDLKVRNPHTSHEEPAVAEPLTGITERKKKKPIPLPSATTAMKATIQKETHTGQDKADTKAPPPGVKPKPKKGNIPIVENPAYRCPDRAGI